MNNPKETNVLRKAILSVVDPVIQDRIHNVPARVIKYNEECHVADVEFYANGARVVRKNVPFSKSLAIVDSHKFTEGDLVWLGFRGGSIQDPFIISKYDPTWTNERDRNKHAQFPEILTLM